MKILGIDPALRNTGYGIIETTGSKHRLVTCGVIRNAPKVRATACLVKINDTIKEIIEEFQPDEVAVEGIIFVQNYQTAITMGAARGVALVACAGVSLPIFEYAPRRVKSAVTGLGQAGKSQVGFMIRALLQLSQSPPADAADALAVAITHAQTRRGIVPMERI